MWFRQEVQAVPREEPLSLERVTHQTLVDGVTTFWEETPEPFTAALVFAAGARHESFTTVEVTHLVEHLVMATLPKSHLDCNATVDEDTTTFYATGPQDEVVGFIEQVCRAIADLPLERLGHEAKVLEAEDGNATHPAIGWSVSRRTGLAGPGLLGTRGAGVHRVTADAVRRHAAEWFVRSNAVLVLTGPPPPALRLPLPDGPRPEEEPWRALGLPLPACMVGEVPRPTLSLLFPRGLVATVAANVLRERILDDLRHERGLVYEVEGGGIRLSATQGLATFAVDGAEANIAEISERLWTIVRELAEHGPTPEEIAHQRVGFGRYLQDPGATMDWLDHVAYRFLYSGKVADRAAEAAEFAGITEDEVRDVVRDAVPTVLLGVPDGTRVPEGLVDHTDWAPESAWTSRGRTFRRRPLAWAPRGLAVTAGEDGITFHTREFTFGAPWDEVVGVGATADMCEVVLRSGRFFPLLRMHLKDYDELRAVIDRHVGDRSYPSTAEEILA